MRNKKPIKSFSSTFFFSKCQVSLRNPNCMDLLCDSEACLVDPKVVEEIRRGQYRWVEDTHMGTGSAPRLRFPILGGGLGDGRC